MTDGRDALIIGHTSEGTLVQRPLSPHLQIYTPQMTSILSIMNRVTGIASSAGTVLLVWWLAAAASGPAAYAQVQWFISSWLGLFMLFGWTAAIFYHLFAGLRHLAWDAGYGFELDKTYASGWAVVGATVLATVLTWAVALWLWPR